MKSDKNIMKISPILRPTLAPRVQIRLWNYENNSKTALRLSFLGGISTGICTVLAVIKLLSKGSAEGRD